MAEVCLQNLQRCSICLDSLRDRVVTPCGHCFCRSCIEPLWDIQTANAAHSCPLCTDNSFRADLLKGLQHVPTHKLIQANVRPDNLPQLQLHAQTSTEQRFVETVLNQVLDKLQVLESSLRTLQMEVQDLRLKIESRPASTMENQGSTGDNETSEESETTEDWV